MVSVTTPNLFFLYFKKATLRVMAVAQRWSPSSVDVILELVSSTAKVKKKKKSSVLLQVPNPTDYVLFTCSDNTMFKSTFGGPFLSPPNIIYHRVRSTVISHSNTCCHCIGEST